jgi:glycosyltransferase involved in cell wall biosynthesis
VTSPLRILILRSNPVAPDPRVEKEAASLAAAGCQVRVLGWDRTAQLPTPEAREGFEVVRLGIRSEYGQGLGNLPQLLRWQWGLWRYLAQHHREFDLIHACDFDTILPAMAAKLLWGKPVIYDVFDFYAEHLRRTPGWIKALIRWTDLWALSRADGVILADEARREQIREARPRRLVVVYNSPRDEAGGLEPEAGMHPPGSRLRLAYIGLFQVERGLLEVLEVMRKHPEWSLVMAGFGGDAEQISALAAGLPNVTCLGRVPYEQALRLSAGADALFATYDPAIPNHRYSSPNKVFEAMMLGKPIIVARDTNMDRIIEQSGCGLVVPYGHVVELERALARLADDPSLRQELGRRARRAYETRFSWARSEASLLELYRQVHPSLNE